MQFSNTKNIILSILLGLIITLLYTANMSWVNDPTACSYSSTGAGEISLNFGDCTKLEYGFPKPFISAKTNVDVNSSDTTIQTEEISTDSSIEIKGTAMIFNIVVWSALSFVLLMLLQKFFRSNLKKAKK